MPAEHLHSGGQYADSEHLRCARTCHRPPTQHESQATHPACWPTLLPGEGAVCTFCILYCLVSSSSPAAAAVTVPTRDGVRPGSGRLAVAAAAAGPSTGRFERPGHTWNMLYVVQVPYGANMPWVHVCLLCWCLNKHECALLADTQAERREGRRAGCR